METERKWIDCDKQLPPEGVEVFGAVYGTDVIVPQEGETVIEALKRCADCDPRVKLCSWEGEENGWWSYDYQMVVLPRYWMAIDWPTPPKIGGAEE
ncbi:MAG: hypothetical protein IJ896_10890 [Fibrobacter sp.]|nr:hypothetical protein [Fibrobacter sp.]